MYADRSEAGRLLAVRVAERLAELQRSDPALSNPELARPVVYALPRGGVPVAVQVAQRLGAPLDLVFVGKIGAPGKPDVAMGAVVDGVDPQSILTEDVFAATRGDAAGLSHARSRELAEIERRRIRYLGDRAQISPAGRVVVIVDDGLATGATAKAALSAVKRQGARLAVLAVPVAPADSIDDMLRYADEMIVLQAPREFWAIGPFYRDFHQLSDDETVGLLQKAWARRDDTETGDV